MLRAAIQAPLEIFSRQCFKGCLQILLRNKLKELQEKSNLDSTNKKKYFKIRGNNYLKSQRIITNYPSELEDEYPEQTP